MTSEAEAEAEAEARRFEDVDLVAGSLRGDARSVRLLASRLACIPRILYSINHRMGRPLRDEDLADLSQDTVVVLWGKLSTFEGRGRLETWAYRFCFLEFMNRLRLQERRERNVASVDSLDSLEGRSSNSEARDFEMLERGLDELGPPESEVIRSKHFEGRTFEEIAVDMDLASSTVKSRYYRGLDWLRRRLVIKSR